MVLKEYKNEDKRSLFGLWFTSLDAVAAAKVAVALNKVERGAISNVKPDGQSLVILLIGGTKKRQQRDIDTAKSLWTDYKARKKGRS